MGIFDSGIERNEFDQFKSEVLSKFSTLENSLNRKTSELEAEIKLKATDSEESARASAENAAHIESNIRSTEQRVGELLKILENCNIAATEKLSEINETRLKSQEHSLTLESSIHRTDTAFSEFLNRKESLDTAATNILEHVEKIKNLLSEGESLSQKINEITELKTKASEQTKNINDLLEGALKKKVKIDDLHKEIFGYEITSDDGTIQTIDGLRDELEDAYNQVRDKVDSIDSTIANLVDGLTSEYQEKLNKQNSDFELLVSDSEKQIQAIDGELKALMPGGMAAGLSAAYEEKKNEEIKSQNDYATSFQYAIAAMICISCIPFGVDAYLLISKNIDIVQVVKDTPNLILSILPLYFPVLWFAFSTNKKLNLSKRLIEEYTHKAVLGKTFSGLSNQIVNLPHESAVKDDLRTRLLFNILQVSSENPGKLITDYNKSDHPFMEALENSAKLGAAIETLSKLPGFSALAEKLSKKSSTLIENQKNRVVDGLNAQDTLDASNDTDKTAANKE